MSAAELKRLSAAANKRSIIIFKNQFGRLPATRRNAGARAAAAYQAQAGVRAELTQLHARNVKSFSIINAMSATISQAEVKHLQRSAQVQAVVPDAFRHFAPLGLRTRSGAAGDGGQDGERRVHRDPGDLPV